MINTHLVVKKEMQVQMSTITFASVIDFIPLNIGKSELGCCISVVQLVDKPVWQSSKD